MFTNKQRTEEDEEDMDRISIEHEGDGIFPYDGMLCYCAGDIAEYHGKRYRFVGYLPDRPEVKSPQPVGEFNHWFWERID